jgi:hypothetical protein
LVLPMALGHSPYAPLIEGSDNVLIRHNVHGAVGGYGTVFRTEQGWDVVTECCTGSIGVLEGWDLPTMRLCWREVTAHCMARPPEAESNLNGIDPCMAGTVFKLNKDGSDYRICTALATSKTVEKPQGPLLEGSDGFLYRRNNGLGRTRWYDIPDQ